jgi:hypothetical protein
VSSDDIPNDPYWLADHWLDIQVIPEDGNFTVTIRAGSALDNLEVLGPATRYAHEHVLAQESRRWPRELLWSPGAALDVRPAPERFFATALCAVTKVGVATFIARC